MKEKNPVGRPPKYDLIAEAKKLNDWSKEEDSYSLYEFTDDKDYLATELSHFADRCPQFNQSLKKAKERLSVRREQAVHAGVFNYGIWNRNARVYDHILRMSEDQDFDAEAKRKKETESHITPETIVKFDQLMNQLSSLQSASKIAVKSISKEQKS